MQSPRFLATVEQTPRAERAGDSACGHLQQVTSTADPFKCAGFDEAREVGLGERYVMVLSCNRDGLLAAFAADGSLIATHETSGKPVVVTLFAYDESGQAVDKLLVEEYGWGTGVQTREQVVYLVTDHKIVELWRREVFVRAGGGGVRDQYLDGYVLHRRGEYDRHGPLLVYGVRPSPHGRYTETVFEIARDSVRPYSGHTE
jgi:hypothetical protein